MDSTKQRIRLRQDVLVNHLAARDISQNAWALRLGISKAYMSQLLRGQRSHPGAETRGRLLEATGLNFEDLFEFEETTGEPAPRSLVDIRRFGLRLRLDRLERADLSQPRGDGMLTDLWFDLKYAARTLSRTPGFTLAALVILGLAIGANTSIYSLTHSALLRPLPYPAPERIVHLWETSEPERESLSTASPANYVDWKQQTTSFSALSAYTTGEVVLAGDSEPEFADAAWVEPDFFASMGISPSLGSIFRQQSTDPLEECVVALGHGIWQRRMGGDRSAVGKRIEVDGELCRVTGVMPKGFAFPLSTQLWKPLVFDFDIPQSRGAHYLSVVGRLADGVSHRAAQADLDVVAERLSLEHDQNADTGVRVVKLHQDLASNSKSSLLVLQGAVGLVLLIACANVANLILARSSSRRQELAVRQAIGASRSRVVRQMLSEASLVAAGGAALGVGLAVASIPLVLELVPASPLLEGATVDRGVLAFTLLVSMGVCVLCGLLPSLQFWRNDPRDSLAQGGKTSSSGAAQNRLRNALITVEVATAFLLVVGAALLLQTFWKITSVDPGFELVRTAAVQISLPDRYDEPATRAFYEQLLEGTENIPGVDGSGTVGFLPLGGSWMFSFDVEGRDPLPPGDKPSGVFRPVGGDYFATMGIPLIEGRSFASEDHADGAEVVIINETLARRFFPQGDALQGSLRIGYGSDEPPPRRIVGVVRDVKQWGVAAPSPPGFYLPHSQIPFNSMNLVLRTSTTPEVLTEAVKERVWVLDPNLAVGAVQTLEDRLSASIRAPRSRLQLIAAFAGLALGLALLGVYSLVAYSVSQRLPEVGVRMALGAGPKDIVRLFMSNGASWSLLGMAIGLGAALGLTRLLSSFLFQTSTTDPLTFTAVVVLVGGSALLACYLPARRALRADPVDMLRTD